jgi:small subunit ribosomal protein S17
MNKTIVVRVDMRVQHPIYKRVIRKSAHFKAQDDKNECRTGDRVKIMETKPLSATKRWRVVGIVERAK